MLNVVVKNMSTNSRMAKGMLVVSDYQVYVQAGSDCVLISPINEIVSIQKVITALWGASKTEWLVTTKSTVYEIATAGTPAEDPLHALCTNDLFNGIRWTESQARPSFELDFWPVFSLVIGLLLVIFAIWPKTLYIPVSQPAFERVEFTQFFAPFCFFTFAVIGLFISPIIGLIWAPMNEEKTRAKAFMINVFMGILSILVTQWIPIAPEGSNDKSAQSLPGTIAHIEANVVSSTPVLTSEDTANPPRGTSRGQEPKRVSYSTLLGATKTQATVLLGPIVKTTNEVNGGKMTEVALHRTSSPCQVCSGDSWAYYSQGRIWKVDILIDGTPSWKERQLVLGLPQKPKKTLWKGESDYDYIATNSEKREIAIMLSAPEMGQHSVRIRIPEGLED